MQIRFKNLLEDEVLSFDLNFDEIIIGRNSQSGIILPHESVSNKHCTIRKADNCIYITDHGSKNGIFIDNVRIEANSTAMITSYQQFNIGAYECELILDIEEAEEKIPAPRKQILNQRTSPNLKLPEKKKKNSNKFLYVLPVLCLAVGYVIWHLTTEEVISKAANSLTASLEQSNPELKLIIKEDVQKIADYRKQMSSMSCANLTEECDSLVIDPKLKEGVIKSDNTYKIFLNPRSWNFEDVLSETKSQDGFFEAKAVERVLNSSIFSRFIKKEVGQIQIIILKDKNSIGDLFLIDQSLFPVQKISANQLLADLEQFIQMKNPEQFLINYSRVIPKIQFPPSSPE